MKLIKNKKAQAGIIISILLVVLSLSSIILVWNFTKPILESPEEVNCIYLINGLSINNACYLNENEVAITINKKTNEPTNKLRFTFTGLDTAIWEITGEKCLDAHLLDETYGHYCKLPSTGETFTYVFNVSGLEKKEKIILQVGNNLCFIADKEIKESC